VTDRINGRRQQVKARQYAEIFVGESARVSSIVRDRARTNNGSVMETA
jgi:hypothetical protein